MGLPDPTSELDWSYIGAIHEIFHKNALKNPDAPCVTETASSTTPERNFNYKQIYEASNVLANQLHEAGIAHGDVVMIFAYRSVELVIAFLGTLAAGATITVLDPAYPPARQQIYLEVSQPKALITIGKARDENGTFAPRVQNYIDEELSLKIQIPELRMSDDGHLTGGQVDGKEVFIDAEGKASAPPDVLVGPDSISILSFTSGTTSTPKGVLGRHYSLAKYFPWMAKTFNWTSDTKFACLSGISHDPIQRDIFSPIFMGGELIIPARENIAHERLAEWFRDHKPNAVHLTPAMGQILCGGAKVEFPSLKWVLYVGDILTKKDCAALRKLAPNAEICAAYGTTETSRSVSYYHIKSHAEDPNAFDKFGDIVPAGKGIENVQLLVVNREDPTKLCGIGESHANNLLYGYLNDPEKTKEKFLDNWFVDNQKWVEADNKVADQANEPWRKYYKGPRDRIYRTGDLGYFLDDSGDCAITGRADDQVKVRGFRIELNEIDTNLKGHRLVRECKTLLRRDRNEEPTLVSYIVPEHQEWIKWLADHSLEDTEQQGTEIGAVIVYSKRYRPMQTEIRDHLKSRLPVQAVPSYFIFLQKMPLNPNGKIDSPNLPFPDAALISEEASEEDLKRWETLSNTEKEVAEQWATLINGLNAKTLQPESDFFESGGHSLLAQQLILNTRKHLGVNLLINSLYSNSSLRALSAHIDRQREGKDNSDATEDDKAAYAHSLDKLLASLDAKYQTADPATLTPATKTTVFVTGATGFLGSYIVKDLLERQNIHVIAHVRGTNSDQAALERLQRSLRGYGVWQDSWATRLTAVTGDLTQPRLGLDNDTWGMLSDSVDVVIHNGALVHWVKQYKHLERSNVLSTIDAMRLCNQGKPKIFTFISSTSVLDTDHYINLSHEQTSTGKGAVMEADDMMGSRTGLGTGYGQSKWVSEQLVREAGRRGLLGSVVRPGYILGDATTGVCNNDDFLIRMLKGCIQLSSRPYIINTINAVPVGHVSTVAVAASLNPLLAETENSNSNSNDVGVHVVHVTAHPRLRMNEYLSILSYYGYDVNEVDYDDWKAQLETFVSAGPIQKDEEQSALMPLFHMAITDLPTTTRAPELNDRNAVAILKADANRWTGIDKSTGEGIDRECVGRFLRYLAETGFLPWPSRQGRELPAIKDSIIEAQKFSVGGRGGVV
ncbi:hypothetical protein AU210_000329 [Fusarium oxysporum f. sp. radicis-cucumerinum]|uniref:Alpha-aminoadipate reductase n=1 Tax=Fusarium oxysporum f. sp. radicis-cucumerinum TaxID=327505 RepID=A0A2H3I4S1_FUSOX|nr:hypothetical protein AU210_000329 [Fusarium oxysporum f. sp. radicis-cucumerinum]